MELLRSCASQSTQRIFTANPHCDTPSMASASVAAPDVRGEGGGRAITSASSFELVELNRQSNTDAAAAATAAAPAASSPALNRPSSRSRSSVSSPDARLASLYALPPRRNGFQRPWHRSQIGVWFALLTTFLIWFALMLPFVPRGSYAGRSAEFHIYNMLYIALIVVGMPFYWRVQSCDPGMTPQEMEPYMEQGSMAGIVRRESAPGNDIGVARVCEKCDLWMGPRTKHCHLCRKCIDGFDHHCLYLNTCVGRRNYQSFILMLTLLNCLLALQLYVTLSLLIRAGQGDPNVIREISDSALGSREAYLALLVALSLVPLIFLGFVLALWAFHIYIILRGLTTYEWILEGRAAREKIKAEKEEAERKARSAQLTASKQQVEAEWLANREAEKKKRASIIARNGSVSSRPPFPAVRAAAAKPTQPAVVAVPAGGGDQPSLTVQLATHSHSSSRELGLGSANSGGAASATTPAHAYAAARPDTLSEVTLEMKEEQPQSQDGGEVVPASSGGAAAAFNLSVDADPADADTSPPAAHSSSPHAVPRASVALAMSPRAADECLVVESANPLLSAIAQATGIGGGGDEDQAAAAAADDRQRGGSYMLPVPPYVLAQQEAAAASRRATQAPVDKESDSAV